MRARHLIWSLTAASLLTPESIGVVQSHSGPYTESVHHNNQTAADLPTAARSATERFRDVNAAIDAGYIQAQGCVSGPDEGAMGVHYVKGALFDSQLDVEFPEVLVYEPKSKGRLDLVAAEYVTPAEAWETSHPGVQPELMGHLLHYVPGPNRYGAAAFYELHVWAWKNNPHGTFADWNPNVSCADWTGF
jgi:hypothetical protein